MKHNNVTELLAISFPYIYHKDDPTMTNSPKSFLWFSHDCSMIWTSYAFYWPACSAITAVARERYCFGLEMAFFFVSLGEDAKEQLINRFTTTWDTPTSPVLFTTVWSLLRFLQRRHGATQRSAPSIRSRALRFTLNSQQEFVKIQKIQNG